MKSDVIIIDNQGNGFEDAVAETRRVAAYTELDETNSLRLQLLTEELLSLAHSVTGEMKASFWIECEEKQYHLHMTTQTVMDAEKRYLLLNSATSRKNEAARSFLGKLRDAFETAMASEPDVNIPDEALNDLANHPIEIPEWDEYEQSILRKVADQVRIGIRGRTVDMTVSKRFN